MARLLGKGGVRTEKEDTGCEKAAAQKGAGMRRHKKSPRVLTFLLRRSIQTYMNDCKYQIDVTNGMRFGTALKFPDNIM
ncbi:hypothetical protein G6L85_17305 [Agrobacterium rhizogenes]|uniref:hypothetical protein n=1 Tax=Rhizobium rhizogenes TaxID=359 RepID=UPI001573B8B6|nr:hypothetical protein [Rhizobium rhizogenes]NTF69872.1 hypothetical protein [Rhizobium rhizogenes]NTG88061.1 hypothetical protein [Rhizobium rhizogenes]NTH43402.1 hypothetical protein [Rhizobium rhizogenes]NTH56266.1 hypothetical protein [Rhizobium rhizogenes]NTH91035.1 hypothetical protein [Rhizobium rhizogenes]